MNKINDENRQEMIGRYAQYLVNKMDQSTLEFYACIGTMQDFEFHTNQNLEDEMNSLNLLEREKK